MKDLGHAQDFSHSPKSKGKPSRFITSYTTHPSQAFPERSLAIGEIWKQHHEWVNGRAFSLSAVAFSHTPCILHVPNSPHCFLELRVRQTRWKRDLVKNATCRVKGFSSSKCDPCLHHLLHDSVETQLDLESYFQALPLPRNANLSATFQQLFSEMGLDDSLLIPSPMYFPLFHTDPIVVLPSPWSLKDPFWLNQATYSLSPFLPTEMTFLFLLKL